MPEPEPRALLRTSVVGLLAGLVTLSGGGCLFDSFDYLTRVESASPSAADCGQCHGAIYDEFIQSPHAESWTDNAFVDATSGRRFEECLGCHAPATVFVEGAPTLRWTRRDEGVTCISCHLDEGVLAGPAPVTALVEPHPVAAERAIYLQSDLCGKCHEGTFEEWLAAPIEDRRTCQDCHMARVKRKLTQATDTISSVLVSFEDEFEGRAHTFHVTGVDALDEALRAVPSNVERRPDEVRFDVVLVNQVPHLIPTGDFGFRRIVVAVDGLDATGTIGAAWRRELFKELGEALVPLQPHRIALSFPGEVRRVRLRVTSSKRTGPERPVFDREWDLP